MLHTLALDWIHLRSHPLLRAALVVAGGVLIALSARLVIPVPFTPVPITAQTLTILLLAGLLGRWSTASVALYLWGGALGLPVLAEHWGGLARFTGPTGGYLLGFLLGAYVVGWLAERSRGRALPLLGALCSGQMLIYVCGLLWLGRFVPGERVLAAGLYPFLAGDALKLALALAVVVPGRRIVRQGH